MFFEYGIIETLNTYETNQPSHYISKVQKPISDISLTSKRFKNTSHTIYFEQNSSNVGNKIEIDKNAKVILIYGYASKEGTPKHNYLLSRDRALNVSKNLLNLKEHQTLRVLPMGTKCNKGQEKCRKVEISYIY